MTQNWSHPYCKQRFQLPQCSPPPAGLASFAGSQQVQNGGFLFEVVSEEDAVHFSASLSRSEMPLTSSKLRMAHPSLCVPRTSGVTLAFQVVPG